MNLCGLCPRGQEDDGSAECIGLTFIVGHFANATCEAGNVTIFFFFIKNIVSSWVVFVSIVFLSCVFPI